ncbi:MAG: ATP-binding cassette domain-containing protein [Acidobacteria bacterium]|nr:ATP-binding cassette domain-containing protein [Acidobacteriota bacterium]
MSNTNLYPHHRIRVHAHCGSLRIHCILELTAPWTIIFGPSGSGKSTLLRATAGLLRAGQVELSRYTAANLTWTHLQTPYLTTPPHLRSLAYAPQGSVLFPHLSVRKNVAFAADAHNQPSTQLVTEALTLFDLVPLADRLPSSLSGGERQRVNLARAFAVPSPTLLLLDEPFTGIDRSTRDRLIPAIQQRVAQLAVPVLSVTHDVEEALLLRAEVVRLDSGAVTAQGPADYVLEAERASILKSLNLHA